uniref:SRCR domain-containing protein n=1 Tax=Labrus bergylta TaxID=56723 RepID=A0A3Q3G9C1_9LABR
MDTSMDDMNDRVSFTQTNPLFDMSLSRSELYSFQPDDLKPARTRRHWCFYFIIVYLILQTGLNAFLIYKGTTASSVGKQTSNHIPQDGGVGDNFQILLHNNSQETKNLRANVSALQSQVNGLCGKDGQLHQLTSNLNLLNTSTLKLEGKLSDISLKPGTRNILKSGPSIEGEAVTFCSQFCFYAIWTAVPILTLGVRVTYCSFKVVIFYSDQWQFSHTFKQSSDLKAKLFKRLRVKLKADFKQQNLCVTTVNVRLVPGPNRGRLEVKYKGVWGTVCDDNFDPTDGKVVCKMLGFKSITSTFTASPGSGEIWLDDLHCTGTETDIFNCPHQPIGINNCQHNEDVGVGCV